VIVITAQGRLAHQPELKMLRQTSVCEFRLLSNRFARGEEQVEAVTFFCYGEEAEAFCEGVEKGQLISATGTQESQRWTDSFGRERTIVKYRLTWWNAGPRPRPRTRVPGSTGRPRPGSEQPARETSRPRLALAQEHAGKTLGSGLI
jgi:single-stranded DNA-binding protein